MTSLHVCPLARVPAMLVASRAEWVVSLLARADRLPDLVSIAPARRLHLALSDIEAPTPDFILASRAQMDGYLAFLLAWNAAAPLLIHCYAGVSRSTAAAFIALCCLEPATSEDDHGRRLRALSPTATPNRRLVALADAALSRGGRMVAAIEALGRGAECYEGVSFTVPISPLPRSHDGLDAPVREPA